VVRSSGVRALRNVSVRKRRKACNPTLFPVACKTRKTLRCDKARPVDVWNKYPVLSLAYPRNKSANDSGISTSRRALGVFGSCSFPCQMKAVDRVLTNSTAKSISKLDLCALKVGTVTSAITAAQPKGVVAAIDDTASYTIVAMCGKTEKVFEIPYPETVELEKLKKTNPQVASLWDLAYSISRRTFGKQFSFYSNSASQDEAFQTRGAEIVPSIKSGTYDRGFQNGSHLESLLNKYSGPVKEIDPWYVEFVGPVPADLLQYQLPKYPPLARQTRIEGEVRLVVVLEPQTGLVKEVNVTSGHPLLTEAAVAAVRDWHFQEGNPRIDSLEVALRFILRCPSD
jgi:TonB family protein